MAAEFAAKEEEREKKKKSKEDKDKKGKKKEKKGKMKGKKGKGDTEVRLCLRITVAQKSIKAFKSICICRIKSADAAHI